MFLIDIQRDQVDGVRALPASGRTPSAAAALIPVLRARVTGVRGRDVNLENFEDVRGRGLARARVHDHLSRPSRVERDGSSTGAFWTGSRPLAADAPLLEVSIEQSIHERFQHQRRRPDALRRARPGRSQARVTSVRDVEWEDARSGGFMFVFRPGRSTSAPHTCIGILQAPDDPTARAPLPARPGRAVSERLGHRRAARSWPRSRPSSTT